MAKSKAPTPQEIYRQRREREEKERSAYLPPGLINHGNTCFMNSVLQGLIATRLLADMVYFQDIPPEIQVTAATPIVSRRSPQLTNGHNLAGSYEKAWVNTMPIGDMFLTVMYKAWTSQAGRTREIISPKPILGALGQKYDQYLDFAQQDAHEFLRILLDAMRMEEQDIIKQRQPPRPKRRRRTTITPDNIHGTDSDDLPLLSFSDMIFGGQLTSILVCQTCKHVSQTYEDFNDISLSIKGDDYMHHRKRDRFKKLMGRLTGNPSQEKEQPKNAGFIHAVAMLRASSVPPSPRAERDVQLGHEAPPLNHKDTARRRSFDIHVEPTDTDVETDASPAVPPGIAFTDSKSSTDTRDAVTLESENSHVLVNVISPDERRVEFVETGSTNTESSSTPTSSPTSKSVEKVQKQDDSGWAKIGRRISLSVGLGRPRSTDKEKERKERERKTRSIGALMENGSSSDAPSRTLPDPGVSSPRLTVSPDVDSSTKEVFIDDSDTHISSERPSSSSKASPMPIATPKPMPARPAIPFNYRSPSPHRPLKSSHLNPDSAAVASSSSAEIPRSKSPKPPKPSVAEAEYLRKILADVAVAPGNPFATIFKPAMIHSPSGLHTSRTPNDILSASSSMDGSSGQDATADKSSATSWLGMGVRQFTGIEECLRMFTAVEVLDGENKVGCRRCWKIQNGVLHNTKSKDSDADEDEDDHAEDAPASQGVTPEPVHRPNIEGTQPLLQPVSTTRPTGNGRILTSISTPTVSYYTSLSGESPSRSVSSLPFETGSVSETSEESPFSGHAINGGTGEGPGGMSIPIISTTEPDTPTGPTSMSRSAVIAESLAGVHNGQASVPSPHPKLTQELYGYPANSKDSLVIPQRRTFSRKSTNTDPSRTDDDSDDLSDVSSVSGESAASRNSAATSTNPSSASQASSAPQGGVPPAVKEKKPSKPKPVIMRAAYKRYLIATPPPILVVHLKRFQQTSKTPLMSFSHGFKKLDDYISFPEYLDLAPFLAPKKEDYGLGRKGKHREKKSVRHPKDERCMYRLYAVVVHIGNMLGGHYIAYTALPSESPVASSRLKSNVKSERTAPAPSSNLDNAAPNRQTNSASTSDPTPIPAKPKERQWAYISDTVVRLTTLEEVLHAKAYMCMYERC
ncbi:hypothetical protein D9619_010720 [Psilocybe cf. subviscida]|uniref:ubiquitinyl hydrolase 1 n=1 Tax=Psilocybe cf. subviscida TaxID=2480587 RepID=A0A8H5F092_9AGAR|nr:hypothetical protein D9619_010720 [Psilocybe cf. subviscida]